MKYIITLAVIIAVVSCFLYSRVITLEKEKTTLESEKTALLTTVERYKDAQMEANKTIKRLREISQVNKENLDWYNSLTPVEFVKFLQERHNRTKH